MASRPSACKTLNEKKRESTVESNLEVLRVKKRQMSNFILKDLLGDDAEAKIKDIKKSHQKTLRWDQLRINEVYRAVRYFCEKFRVRPECLIINLEKSKKQEAQ